MENFGFEKLKEMLPQILDGTNLQFKRDSKATSTYGGTRYFKLFYEKENKATYTPEIGLSMETKYKSKTLIIHAEISKISSYTVNYINGGSMTFGKFENIDKYEKTIDLDGVIDVGEIDDGKYENGGYFYSVDKNKFLEDYPSYLTTDNGWYALPLDYVEELLKPILEEILTFFKNNMPQVVKKLSSDNVLNHLDEFKRLDKIDLETLSKTYKTCYCCQWEGTPTFKEPVDTEKCISKMSVPYGTIMGSRKYLEYNGELYLWFGEDKTCSLWC